jgi:[acyl-carrier-protein] S-malonyltransferase
MKKTAIVFPGQGSQTLGMLADIAKEFPQVEKTYSLASQVLNYDLWKLVQEGPVEELDNTVHTQPALLAGSYAIWQIIRDHFTQAPGYFAGHSLGEYSALVCANALSLQDGIQLVAARGRYMQEAAPAGIGALAAIVGLENSLVQEICEQSIAGSEVLSPANFNSPGQVVIAGHKTAVEKAVLLAKEKGAKLAKLLPVSVPSHCLLMKPAAERLATLLTTISIKMPDISVLNNVTATIYQNTDEIRDKLVKQLYMPVLWVDIIQSLVQQDITTFIECGPGKVLAGLNKRISPIIESMTTADSASLRSLIEGAQNVTNV